MSKGQVVCVMPFNTTLSTYFEAFVANRLKGKVLYTVFCVTEDDKPTMLIRWKNLSVENVGLVQDALEAFNETLPAGYMGAWIVLDNACCKIGSRDSIYAPRPLYTITTQGPGKVCSYTIPLTLSEMEAYVGDYNKAETEALHGLNVTSE